jgi:hypothetical protein
MFRPLGRATASQAGTQGYDDLGKLAVVQLARRRRAIEQSVRSPM